MTIKLSDTQDAAIREVAELGYTVAKANTIKSLENKGLMNPTSNTHHELTDAGREYLGLPALDYPEDSIMEDNSGFDFHTKLMADVAELEEALKGDPWGEQPPVSVIDLEPAVSQVVTFDKDWASWERELAGFEVANYFRNTDGWDGLTAKEIKEDMKTARPIGREGRRRFERQVRKVTKQLVGSL